MNLDAVALRRAALALCAAMLVAQPDAHAQAPAPGVLVAGQSGDQVCLRCHGVNEGKPILSIHRTRHGVAAQPGCQACHGSSRPHVQHKSAEAGAPQIPRPAPDFNFSGPERSAPEIQSRTCLNCHSGGKRLHWRGSAHPGHDVTCASCHTIHQPADPVLNRETQRETCFKCHQTQRAETHALSTHGAAAGKVACADCHNVHGGIGPKLLNEPTANDVCFTCHAGLRGPFLWEHPPAGDDCMHCHVPHGSNTPPLLKARPPWLCQGCHAGSVHTTPALSGRALAPGAGGTNPSAQLLGRACLNCHSAIHGSNHPSGARFTR
ncbi:MAG: DmsE family decaheme c-type cytochrome [Betaproteobacteria bacterium]|nr:DmsE family decaheme c-type cytochrome [Betaproteobacteria bacterium]